MIKNVHHLCSSLTFVVGTILVIPNTALAAVFISEVAWMGSSESANHEWIELTNDGAAVTVDNWVLSDSQNLQIDLAGTIPANSVVVLERTSDASAPGAAFLLYTGALVNTGTDLSLRDSAGQLVEQVSGGENWQSIGGDNVTKETAQYSSQGWYTAGATPGQYTNSYQEPSEPEPESETEEEETTDTKSTSNKEKSSQSTQTVPLTLPDITLQLEIDSQDIGYVHQTISFSAAASGIGEHLEDSLQYQWNFGDGFTATGKKPTHMFAYAGKYIVTVKAQYKRQVQITRHEITILPVKMSLTQNTHGDVQVHNDTQYELDVSGYRVQGSESFIFPDYSIVLPNQTVTIPRKYLKGRFDPMVAVYDTQGKSVASSYAAFATANTPPSPDIVTAHAVTHPATPARTQSAVVVRQPSEASPPPAVAPKAEPESVTTLAPKPVLAASNTQLAAAATQSLPRSERLTYVGLCVLILLGILGIYLKPRRNQVD